MIFVLLVLIIAGFLFVTTNPSFMFKKSIHKDAKKYSTRHCLVFYPDNKEGKKIAKQMCDGVEDDRIFDYSLVPYGDYYLVSYGNGYEYFVDKEYNSISINEVSDFGRRIIFDYLRYTIKKEQPDKYYDAKFLADLTIDSINFDEVTYDIYQEYLKCSIPSFGLDVLVPLKYMQKEIGMNFNFMDETYVKPVYIDKEHPVIALTFDDGPQLWYSPNESASVQIVDTLYKYDANATFYVTGYALEERDEWTESELKEFLNKSITNGNTFGSHTQNHDKLLDLTAENIGKAINGPANILKNLVGYNMLTYRPPGGAYSDSMIAASPLPAIYWDIDSQDWQTESPEEIAQNVLKHNFDDGDVVLFHEIYHETAKSLETLLPELINRGCQLVSVEDMLNYLGINPATLKYYYNYVPKNYE